jgi:hypothetical protein
MANDPLSAYGAWVIQFDTTQFMVMDLFRGGAPSRPLVISQQHPRGGVCMLRVCDHAK